MMRASDNRACTEFTTMQLLTPRLELAGLSYCHVLLVTWLTIMGSGLNELIY
jgi:hypothetical protein